MKRPLLLPLAIALALSGTHAFALGLGTIQVKSKLNQPLDAEIPILQGTAGEAEGLLVQMAAAEDFDRVGLNRARVSVPLEFTIIKGSHGDAVIKVTSKEIIREPFLDFLVEANWPKGRLLREYTVLLDPPVMAPATGSTVTTVAKTPERAAPQPLPESKPKPAPTPKSAPVAVAPAPAPSRPAEAPSRPAAAPKREVSGNEYTVEQGDTLSGIARNVRPDEAANINQLMLALLKQNPNAFFKDNINALKRGAILRIPSAEEVKAVGSASEAAAQVHAQIEDWRGGAAAKPTLVADTGTQTEAKAPAPKSTPATTTSTAATKPKTDSLELVPPKVGKDTVASADRPGSGASSSATELKSELTRTKEALTSREQETGELKSRVKELEETKGKSDRMITLQKSEIADLQNKLAQLQADSKNAPKSAATSAPTMPAATTPAAPTPAPPAAATTTPATTPASTATPPPTAGTAPATGDKLSKDDIWGNAGAPDAKTGATTPASAPAAAPPVATPPPAVQSMTPGATSPAIAGAANATVEPAGSTSSSTASNAPGTTDSATASSTPPAKPVSTTSPVKPEAKTKVQPLTSTSPAWYQQSWVKPAAIGAGALLVLAALLGMRKRKPALATERGSIAGAFGDSPLSRSSDDVAEMGALDSEEQSLRDQLMHDPGNIGLHLELLSVLYAERNVGAFEDAAENMHSYVSDEHQPEWLEARAMGQELAPHNPLFAEHRAYTAFDDEAVTAPHATMPTYGEADVDEVFGTRETIARAAADPVDTTFDFGLELDRDRSPNAPLSPGLPVEPTFGFDNLPPIDFDNEALRAAEEAEIPAPLTVDEDEFPGEDGVSTKLDLAKAYLDMGDPEGARSMLEEVLAEGNDAQKGEARRLMGEIR
ncbi:MAG: FimV/HubP family polar landmark protein [Rhodanobacteraceae bacterium]